MSASFDFLRKDDREIKFEQREREKAKERKNKDFVQSYRKSMKFWRCISHNSTAVDIMAIVMEHMDHTNSVITTIKHLMVVTGKSKSAVYAAIALLKERKIIKVTNTGGTCIFMVNASIAWTSYHKGKERYGTFNANVLMHESEFPEYEAEIDFKKGSIL